MANKNEVTISLEEYRELLLKEKPNDNEKLLLDRIKDLIFESIEYGKDWDNNIKIEFKNERNFKEELITTIKVIDRELYKTMIKFVCDEKQKKDRDKAQMEKARAIKEIDKD